MDGPQLFSQKVPSLMFDRVIVIPLYKRGTKFQNQIIYIKTKKSV